MLQVGKLRQTQARRFLHRGAGMRQGGQFGIGCRKHDEIGRRLVQIDRFVVVDTSGSGGEKVHAFGLGLVLAPVAEGVGVEKTGLNPAGFFP